MIKPVKIAVVIVALTEPRVCVAQALAQAGAQAPTKTVASTAPSARQAVAGAPTLQIFAASTAQSDLCVGETSAAYGDAMLAVTVDVPRRDAVCSLLRQSKWAFDLGRPDISFNIMCQSAEWRLAAAATDMHCTVDVAKRSAQHRGPLGEMVHLISELF